MRPATGALASLLVACVSAPLAGQAGGLEAMGTRIRALVDSSGVSVGVGIRHLESGREWYLEGDQPFMMGSTFKIATAVQLLTLVDQGRLRLDQQVPLLPGDIFPSGSLLSERFGDPKDPGATLALRRYLELMLILSDNSATDVVLRQIGGPPAVTARVRALGITGMRIDRTVMDIYADYVGAEALPPVERRNLDTLIARIRSRSLAQLALAQRAYHASEKDRSTPRAMVELLTKIARREALSPANTDVLLSIMARDETGRQRIRRFLPAGTKTHTKTGSYGSVVANDVGLVELPGGRGWLAIAVFTEDRSTTDAAKLRLIADIAKAAWDQLASP